MSWLRVGAAAVALSLAVPAFTTAASAETLRWAFQGDAKSLDPYSLNETFTLGFLGNVYEGLTRRGPDLEILPALAERWEVIEPTRWRFHLRKGVKFHNGNDFTADDVVFSAERVRAEGSDLTTRIPKDVVVEKVDDHTVDFVLTKPNPILHYEWDTWYIMDKEWAEANNAVKPTSASGQNESFATFNANGTGGFRITSHEPGVRSVFVPNDSWWDTAEHNLTEVIFTPINSDATRVAALLSGEIDMMYPVPVQDIQRIEQNEGTKALTGPELRTIFLGMDQKRDELLYSDVKGKNPFKDVRVRKAVYQAIDIEAIKDRIMRGLSEPSALMLSPFMYSRSDEFKRHPYDPDAAKKLLAEAGYADGFTVGMDCPNDRYVNDERICQAIVSMLARVGIKVDLNAQPKAQYFAKVLASGGYDTSFYLLGWTPGSFDAHNVLVNLHGCRDDKGAGGPFNLGGFCSEKLDALTAEIGTENDPTKRDELIAQAFTIIHEEVAHVPLHQQGLAWGVRDNVEVVQRADNQFLFRWVKKN
ncbi:ABC transporter substrate-binding protein [Hyphomicrobiales bacterium FT118]|uniref:ABC transporter substrate-binding protein n=2 Tax=Futiania mangrovi TaxID=2959716 RepID=A0A9J6PGC4_9PROT|nr:ABC transporter substrate-binding protein [Futiania mangrovii]MCP1336851.1 ABC transporter substrate-binding protein [Futiania mangrovii]